MRLVLLRLGNSGLRLQENLDAAGGPNSDARTKKVGVLGPNCTAQSQGGSEDRPIVLVPTAQTLPGVLFGNAIGFSINQLHESLQVLELSVTSAVDLPFWASRGGRYFSASA
jgi:hypothetical protein